MKPMTTEIRRSESPDWARASIPHEPSPTLCGDEETEVNPAIVMATLIASSFIELDHATEMATMCRI